MRLNYEVYEVPVRPQAQEALLSVTLSSHVIGSVSANSDTRLAVPLWQCFAPNPALMTADADGRINEAYVQDAFHSYLKSSLTQAKLERLLDADILSSAEADVLIIGPALCLYFAALRSTTSPPSVPLPRHDKFSHDPQLELSVHNCPPAFVGFLRVWAAAVPHIQSLSPEYQHDLARIICGLPPVVQPLNPDLPRIAADLRAIAIEISQRRSFQTRLQDDLQAALDAGSDDAPGSPRMKARASFRPPPAYEETPQTSPAVPTAALPGQPTYARPPSSPPPRSPRNHSSPHDPRPLLAPISPSASSHRSLTPSPTLLTPDTPAIAFIRETLYAALADVLESSPSIHRKLKSDPPRAYFAAVALAILAVSTTAVTSSGSIVGVVGRELTLAECPRALRPFMREIGEIGNVAREMEAQDDEEAVRYIQEDRGPPPVPRLERARRMIEQGAGYEGDIREDGRRSSQGRAVAFANRVNALALGLTSLKAFRERQEEIFQVLSSIGDFGE